MSFQGQKSTSNSDLYLSRKNLLVYLKSQGYDTDAHDSITMAEINAMNSSSNTSSNLDFEVQDTTDKKCSIFYYLKPNQSIKQSVLEDMVMSYYEENDKSKCIFIIIIQGTINDTVQKTIKHLWKKHQEYVVVYEVKHLLVNLLEHSYVPKHEKLTEIEKQALYSSKNILEDKQMPEISMFDPMAKVLLLKPGEVCKITRYNKISFMDDFYRLCVI
jgi:DNA-directed RNA polymerase subunit H (RpoH/RPB5)|tara:strand:+ start:177 stop:824 length:648 start_codon:yes stop_codon:yes gene_type:complete